LWQPRIIVINIVINGDDPATNCVGTTIADRSAAAAPFRTTAEFADAAFS
jgi:hypothetical protein